MHDGNTTRAQERVRELLTINGTTYSARIAEVDSAQLRFELLSSRRPGPIRGRLQMGRRLGSWELLAGTWLDVAELARQHGDDAREFQREIERAARRVLGRFELAVGPDGVR